MASTAAMTTIAAAAPALAQTAAGSEVAEVVVTGSRIPQPNLTSVSPVQVVGQEEIRIQGRTDTADVLNQLPQVFQNDQAGVSSTTSSLSAAGGVSTVDLRGLGPQRTLVLVDGRRLGVGDPNTGNTSSAPDINQIPSQLIERIDVLTGGASAVYGSDAIAGVVNFIMRRNFEGLQVDAQWGVYQHHQQNDLLPPLQAARHYAPVKDDVWDGKSRDLSVVMGVNGANGDANVTGYITYHDQDPVTQGQRDYSACQLNASAAGVPSCAGSSNSNIFFLPGGAPYSVVGHTLQPYNTTAATSPPPVFNSNPYLYLMHQDTRFTAGFFARYRVNDHFEAYSDFSFMNDRSTTQVAASGLFQFSGPPNNPNLGFFVNCNNPLLSSQQAATLCTPAQLAAGSQVEVIIGRRNLEGGPRVSDYEHQNYRAVLGLKGEITEAWRYDIYGSYYYTTLDLNNENYLSISRIQEALLVTRNAQGNPVCTSGNAACVPYNIFTEGGVTPEQVAYLNSSGSQYGAVRQTTVEANVTGDLGGYGVRSPWAQDGVGIALGAQVRRDHMLSRPDQASLGGDLSGFGGASTAIDAGVRVAEVYTEVRAPLVQDAPWAREVMFEGGYRYSDYSTGIQTKTWKLGLQWAPVDDLSFRTSYQSAIRAPNIIELYTPQAVSTTTQLSSGDPCAATRNADNTITPARATLAQCQRTGVTAAQYGNGSTTNTIAQCPSNQCSVLLGGNPDLEEEDAKTFSVGMTFTPSFIEGLTGSLDYWRIKLQGAIGTIPLGVVMQNCLDSGDPTFCSLIRRAPSGALVGSSVQGMGYIIGSSVNVGENELSGIDAQVGYHLPLDRFGWDRAGSLEFNFAGSYLDRTRTTPLEGEPTYDCAGLFGPQCQTLNPRWRHTLRVSWRSPWNAQLSASWRYIGEVTYEGASSEPNIGGSPNAFINKLPSRSYLDLAANWKVNDSFTVRAGASNVLDKDPPVLPVSLTGVTGNPNTFTSYDLLGRRLYVGVTASF